jgi:hypothetical protein
MQTLDWKPLNGVNRYNCVCGLIMFAFTKNCNFVIEMMTKKRIVKQWSSFMNFVLFLLLFPTYVLVCETPCS